MADTMQFDLVSPERKLLSVQVSEVQIPGAEGDLTAMPGHAPTLTTLRPGVLRVVAGGQVSEYAVTGGFAEITLEGVSVLAERAVSRADLTQGVLEGWIAEAHRAAKAAGSDDAAKLVSDMVAIGAQVGLNASIPA
jgi:F-type H+-transporting ATPase subunit epsilon